MLATATDWSAFGRVHTVEENWSLLKANNHLFTEAIVPLQQQKRHGQSKPWMTKRVREQYKLRDSTWAAYVEAKTHKIYREQRSKAGHVQRKVRMAYETDLASTAAINPKELFGHIQQNRRLKKQIVTQGDLFAETFYRTFRPDTLTPIPTFSKVTQPMPPIVFTPESMMEIL